MKYTESYMNDLFKKFLLPGEESLCGVYCGFPETVFFAKPGRMQVGFATCTNYGRLLIVRQYLTEYAPGSLKLDTVKKLNIKKTIFGQINVDATFPTDKKDIRLKMQIAKKIYGVNFPNQEHNLATMMTILQRYETPS